MTAKVREWREERREGRGEDTQNWLSFQSSAKASMLKIFPEAFSSAPALRSSNCFSRASRSA